MALGIGVEVIHKKAFKNFNFDAKKFIDDSLKIINADITQGIVDRVQIDGSAMPSLTLTTIKMKEQNQGLGRVRAKTQSEKADYTKFDKVQRRSGVAVDPEHPLIDTGYLVDPRSRDIKIKDNVGEITIKAKRKEIAMDLQINGVGKRRKKFYFFGISKRAVEKIRTLLRLRWGESFEIKRG